MKEFSSSNGKYLVNKVKDLISETKNEIVSKLENITSSLGIATTTKDGLMSKSDRGLVNSLIKNLFLYSLSRHDALPKGSKELDFNNEKVSNAIDSDVEYMFNRLDANRYLIDGLQYPTVFLDLDKLFNDAKNIDGGLFGKIDLSKTDSIDKWLYEFYNYYNTTERDTYKPNITLVLSNESLELLGLKRGEDRVVRSLYSWDEETQQEVPRTEDPCPLILIGRAGDPTDNTSRGKIWSSIMLLPTNMTGGDQAEMPVYVGTGKLYFDLSAMDKTAPLDEIRFLSAQAVFDANTGIVHLTLTRDGVTISVPNNRYLLSFGPAGENNGNNIIKESEVRNIITTETSSTNTKVQTLESNNKQYFLGNFESVANVEKAALAVGVADAPDKAILVGTTNGTNKKPNNNIIILNNVVWQTSTCQQYMFKERHVYTRRVSLENPSNGYYTSGNWIATHATDLYVASQTDTEIEIKQKDVTGAAFGGTAKLPSSTSEKAGLMSAADKRKLDSNAQSVSQLVLNQNNLFSVIDDEPNAKTIAQGSTIQFASTDSIRATVDAANSKVSFKVLGTREEKEDFADLREHGLMIINDVELYSGNDYSVRRSTIIWDSNNTEEDETNYSNTINDNPFMITTKIYDNVHSILHIGGSVKIVEMPSHDEKWYPINTEATYDYLRFEETEILEQNNCKGLKILWENRGFDYPLHLYLEVTYILKDPEE